MEKHELKKELEKLASSYVNYDNEGFVIDYRTDQKEIAKSDFEKIKAAGFNARLKGRKALSIYVKIKVVRQERFRIIEVSK